MKYEELVEEIDIELEYLEKTVYELLKLNEELCHRNPNIRENAFAGTFLAQFYNGIENILKRFYKYYGKSFPTGADWHISLFKSFCDPPHQDLPLIFSKELQRKLIPFRRFRHIVRHGYAFQLEWEKMKPGIDEINETFTEIKKVLKNLLEELKPKD